MNAKDILTACIQDIDDRAQVRDMPEGERSMARCVAAFNALTGASLTETQGWLFMAVLKASRATAGAYHADDWQDMAAYVALAGESAAAAVFDCRDAYRGGL